MNRPCEIDIEQAYEQCATRTFPGLMSILLHILRISASTTWQLLPYVVLGVLAAEGLRYTPVTPLLERGCRAHPAIAIPMAAGLGIVSPLCTYGTVPLVLTLLSSGVPLAPLATFLSASALMNPQLFLITWGGLGAKMAIARLAAVLVCGLLLGTLLHLLPARWSVATEPREEAERGHRHRHPFSLSRFLKSCGKTLQFVGFYVLLGVVLGAAIEVLVPGRWILATFGSGGWLQVLVAALLGVPLYACGGGTIPLVRSLIENGMAQGAALAFLVAGPATRIPPLMALATIVRPVVVGAYIVYLIIFSVASGLLYGLL
jgi:uncharacterized protein